MIYIGERIYKNRPTVAGLFHSLNNEFYLISLDIVLVISSPP